MTQLTSRNALDAHIAALRSEQGAEVIKIRVGMSTCGRASGAEDIYHQLEDLARARGLSQVRVVKTGCIGLCHAEPLVEILLPDQTPLTLQKITAARAVDIIDALATNPELLKSAEMAGAISPLQQRIVLRHCGAIDPENIDDYLAGGGYQQYACALFELTPQAIIETIKASGLRGRGGGGFPTGVKWETASKVEAAQKYIVCNADEGDPGAFMDRSVLEGDPHAVIEAMAIAGRAIGASQGIIYVRAEYPLAIHHLRTALQQARDYGLLGNNILGSDVNFDIRIKLGAGAFVCGEETALIHSIEGKRGEPTVRPPFPALSGLWEKPTVVNNVETLANIVPILENGSAWFRAIGTEKSPGTKVFALAGSVKNVGLVEVPMGTTVTQVISELGGGSRSGRAVKAVQTGGPSGGCIPAEKFDTPIEYESLLALGSMMGSGGMIVMEEGTSMVEIARFYQQFTCDESCGKCTPCRIGTKRLLQLLDELLAGQGTPDHLLELESLGQAVKDGSLCGLGQTAPNPILSTLRWYRAEYEFYALGMPMRYRILAEQCIGCTACARACPVSCIDGTVKHAHTIRQAECIHCGACLAACKFQAVIKEAETSAAVPV